MKKETKKTTKRSKQYLFSTKWIALMSIVAMTAACNRDNVDPQPASSLIPKEMWPAINPLNDRACVEMAYKKIKEMNRPYHFADRSNVEEPIKDIWIGQKLFQIPTHYIGSINYGAGRLAETPGITVGMQAYMPDLRFTYKDDPNPADQETAVYIRLTCRAGITMTSGIENNPEWEASERDWKSNKFKRPLPELNLQGNSFGESRNSYAMYSPPDENLKHPDGRPIRFRCDSAYPAVAESKPLPATCWTGFLFQDQIFLEYTFRETQLPQWRQINDQVIK